MAFTLWPKSVPFCLPYVQQSDGTGLSCRKEPYPDTSLQSVLLSPERSLQVYAPGRTPFDLDLALKYTTCWEECEWTGAQDPQLEGQSCPKSKNLLYQRTGDKAHVTACSLPPSGEQRDKLHNRTGAHWPLRKGSDTAQEWARRDMPPRLQGSDLRSLDSDPDPKYRCLCSLSLLHPSPGPSSF